MQHFITSLIGMRVMKIGQRGMERKIQWFSFWMSYWFNLCCGGIRKKGRNFSSLSDNNITQHKLNHHTNTLWWKTLEPIAQSSFVMVMNFSFLSFACFHSFPTEWNPRNNLYLFFIINSTQPKWTWYTYISMNLQRTVIYPPTKSHTNSMMMMMRIFNSHF